MNIQHKPIDTIVFAHQTVIHRGFYRLSNGLANGLIGDSHNTIRRWHDSDEKPLRAKYLGEVSTLSLEKGK
jgi:hypothetical protein